MTTPSLRDGAICNLQGDDKQMIERNLALTFNDFPD